MNNETASERQQIVTGIDTNTRVDAEQHHGGMWCGNRLMGIDLLQYQVVCSFGTLYFSTLFCYNDHLSIIPYTILYATILSIHHKYAL